MITLDTALTFFAVSSLLAITPGPDNIFVLTQSAVHGRLAGLLVVAGLCTGLIGHTLAVTAGLAAVVAASEHAFMAIKILGVIYLLYLAIQSFKASKNNNMASTTQINNMGLAKLYRRGIIMNLTNPKVSLFFLAFLPQFTYTQKGSIALQTISLGLLFILATIIIFGSIAMLSGLIGERLQRSPKAHSLVNKIAGAVFVGLALKLITSQRH